MERRQHTQSERSFRAPLDRAWLRGVLLGLAILSCAWLGISLSGIAVDDRGGASGALTTAVSPLACAGALALLLVVSTAIACGIGRLVNAIVGLFVLGTAVTAFAMQTGTAQAAIFDGANLASIGVETLAWTIPIALLVTCVFRVSGPLPDVPLRGEAGLWREYFDIDALKASLVGALIPVVAWFVVRTMMKGQAIGGVFVGGVAAGMAFRLVAPRVQPVVIFVSPILLMGAYQWFVASRLTASPSVLLALGSLPPELRVMPLDTVAGTLTGVAIGIGWARSFKKTDTIAS